MTEMNIKNRYEIVFIYDVRDANPNGDPDTSNMPRMDDFSGENIVTDVRLKRTIRDYWISKGKSVLIRAVTDNKGNRKSMEDLSLDFLNMGNSISKKNSGKARAKLSTEMPKEFIDVRTFGAAVTLTNANFSHTGTVQFGLGRSLNKPNIQTRTITTTLSSGKNKGQGAIGSYHTVDYSLIRFHGIISEITAKNLNYTENDLHELLKAMWNGTKQLNTRSKFNHIPRILIIVETKENKSQIGDLDLGFNLLEKEINSIEEAEINTFSFSDRINKLAEKVNKISYKIDEKVQLYKDDKKISKNDFITNFKDIKVEKLNLEDV